MSNDIRLFEEAAKNYFSSRKKIYFHNKNYKIDVDTIDLVIIIDPVRLCYSFCFYLTTRRKDTKEILTNDNFINESREGGRISFDDMIYDCHNFDVIKSEVYEEYYISCGFRVRYIDVRNKGLQALVGEYYDGEEEKKNIKYNRFEIMDI